MKVSIKQIYCNHTSLASIVVSLIAFFFLSVFIAYRSTLRFNQNNYFSKYDYVAESSIRLTESSYYDLSNTITVHLKNHLEYDKCQCIVHSYKIMQNDIYSATDKLNPFELSIAKNVALKNKINVGDMLYLFIDNSGIAKPFTVKTISDYCYGIKNVDFNSPSGLIVMGYTDAVEISSTQYITLLSDCEKARLSPDLNYRLFDISNEKRICGFLATFFPFISSICVSLILFIEYHVFSGDYFKRIAAMRIMGERHATLKKEIFKSMIPVLAVGLSAGIVPLICFIAAGNIAYLFVIGINVFAIAISFLASLFVEFRREKTFK